MTTNRGSACRKTLFFRRNENMKHSDVPAAYHRAFTLIELLIVVAIIGILAAIAVPNFLNAQTRAKVSRVISDLKALEKGLEQYYMDNNAYPYTGPGASANNPYPLRKLTTPISYLSALPRRDPFRNEDMKKSGYALDRGWEPYLLVTFPVNTLYGKHDPKVGSFRLGPLRWFLNSVGPDGIYDPSEYGYGAHYWTPYTPTNGLMSLGELFIYGPGGITSDVATSNAHGHADYET